MSTYEIIIIVFLPMSFLISLVRLIIDLAGIISDKKKK